MLSYLRGTVLIKKERYIILVVGENTGYRVQVTNQVLENIRPSTEVSFYIYTHLREDAIELYGFTNLDELDFFEKLLTISGVGPRIALGVLSVAPLSDIKKAIIHGDPALLQKVTSVGKKTAERIIIELKEKVTVTDLDEKSGMSITENIQLFEALASLGYKDSEVRSALRQVPPEAKDLSEKIKEALKILGKSA
ncbi:MAG: Holliday junction DNA helicase RuvA [Candidatus Komeilibacteria bacterium RIFCSPLOWO2_01_FULL_52_15]|uniref:Holliday junction branch migration complex subunit RuvA n=2 Tax=Candidatus Komeiliibacteriota TaxID=1817908 RepID=A0A1G2BT40_9BACT|nr:MAG: Holliday junction DNA helicase RuvA [Candidatus Komeilibacteria bacterium RIFCSPHIGHO2_01_FULL_52_14]OGY92066.1 MAG: Holliday junction DNA helicase RuvA [Candidatus Komeilibacteria bacterium RIFCSPLOWO2_01_FULL_52_15]